MKRHVKRISGVKRENFVNNGESFKSSDHYINLGVAFF